jgi:hypothetical protein
MLEGKQGGKLVENPLINTGTIELLHFFDELSGIVHHLLGITPSEVFLLTFKEETTLGDVETSRGRRGKRLELLN